MNWFFIALLGPILYATSNHIDKYLVSKYLPNKEVGSLIIFSSIFSIIALPIIIIIQPDVLSISLLNILSLIISGSIVIISILCYLYALQKDEATLVVPWYQTIPIFAFILGYFILGEKLLENQIYASIIIIVGAIILSFDITETKLRFKKRLVILMLSASFFYALSDVVFKLIALDNGFWISLFWSLVGKVIIGIIFFVFIKSYRIQFIEVVRLSGKKIMGVNSINEVLTIFADSVVQYAILLAPITLVLLVNGFQPFFVFIIGLGLTIFAPQISKENVTKKILLQKFIGIVIIITGSIFLR